MPPSDAATGQEAARSRPVTDQPRLAGDEGVWSFITADLCLFAVLFLLFMVERFKAPVLFETSRQHLDPLLGAVNTLILLSSSWLVALAVHHARDGRRAAVRRHLLLALLVGAGFAATKIYEYWHKVEAGITLLTNDFFMFYFALTGLHFLHYLGGMAVLTLCLVKSRAERVDGPYLVWIESSGCYWHMVDLLWLVLFPMIYLLRAP